MNIQSCQACKRNGNEWCEKHFFVNMVNIEKQNYAVGIP